MNPHRRQTDFLKLTSTAAIVVLFLYIMFLNFYGCTRYPKPVSPYVAETNCANAYLHIKDIGCDYLLTIPGPDEKDNTADDIPWTLFCERVQRGSIMQLGLNCAMTKTTCDEIELCL